MNVPYTSPSAFRRALTDRLRAIAHPHGPWPLPDLQRQFAYDRLLARLYLTDTGWIIKGATALLAREIAVRHTIDIDMYRATTRDHTEQRPLSGARYPRPLPACPAWHVNIRVDNRSKRYA